ncbi:MAG: 30S ribosomal protein S6 [Candidatus Shikimatogenerans sp. Tduv]|uniref:Small ribosomal subunit protein bS6 n=1 Tax=Candidatus Shikimatogenerans sp. Tduv TaxID=3158567 RepID=A0AAU7QQW9_9FLAO
MNLYEIVLIIDAFLKKKKKKDIINILKKYILNKNGEIIYKKSLGIKNFEYNIKKKKNGFYYLLEINILPKYILNIKKIMNNEECIIRYLIIKLNKYSIKYLHSVRNIKI